MTKPTARARPLSPHLSIYRPPITMTTSIVHRITGCALYFGTLFVAWWLLAAATSEQAFATANWFFGSIIGRLILFGYSWTLIHHMLGGVRHLVWDTGAGLDKDMSSRIAWLSIFGSIALTLLVWAVALVLRGGF